MEKDIQNGVTGTPQGRGENPQTPQEKGTGYQNSKMPIGKACEDIRQARNLLATMLHDIDDVQATLQGGLSAFVEKAEELKDCAQAWPHTMRNEVHNELVRAAAPLSHEAERAGREIYEKSREAVAALETLRRRVEEVHYGFRANWIPSLTLAGVVYLIIHTW